MQPFYFLAADQMFRLASTGEFRKVLSHYPQLKGAQLALTLLAIPNETSERASLTII